MRRDMIVMEGLGKHYDSEMGQVPALSNISLRIDEGDLCAIVGASGSGKSTLMNIAGLLDRPTHGRYWFRETDVATLSREHLADIRNRHIGFVFQAFHLLRHLSAVDNVALPLLYRGVPRDLSRNTALEALQTVGLAGREWHQPLELSGGQQQRVAIARAVVGKPSLILADEPTGNLDSQAANEIMNFLVDLNRSTNLTVVLITHDRAIAARCRRQIVVHDGMIASDSASNEG